VSEREADAIMTLPVHQYLSMEQIDYAAEQIKRFYAA
jgi:dTDP-4-amino-4,6-dideoxygalactose transaminase